MKRRGFSLNKLSMVARAESFRNLREPPLQIGDYVQLNGGGPILLLVAIDGENVTVAWRHADGEVSEASLPQSCLHRRCPLRD
jgi:hypothetical protein